MTVSKSYFITAVLFFPCFGSRVARVSVLYHTFPVFSMFSKQKFSSRQPTQGRNSERRTDTFQIELFGTEQTVAGIAETGNDIAYFVQLLIHSTAVDFHIGM